MGRKSGESDDESRKRKDRDDERTQEPDDEEETPAKPKVAKAPEPRTLTQKDAREWLSRKRDGKRRKGYREKAEAAGFNLGEKDFSASLTSISDVRRCMRFVPENLDTTSYDEEEVKARMRLCEESIPASAAREAQVFLEGALRHIMTEAVLRTVESNRSETTTAATMHQVLRPYAANLAFSAAAPKGLLRHAIREGVLAKFEEDDADEKKKKKKKEKELTKLEELVNQKNLAHAAKRQEAEDARKAAFKARREELAAIRKAKAAA